MLKLRGWDIRRRDSYIPMQTRLLRQFQFLADLYRRLPPGDIVECGVWQGNSLFILAHLVYTDLVSTNNEDSRRTIWGFDSFKGFPPPTKHDDSTGNPVEGQYKNTTQRHVQTLLMDSGIPREFVELWVRLQPGYFSDTLPNFPERPIAMLHIDADLYESHTQALSLYPKVVSGGIVAFDDYDSPAWPGATKAVKEYFEGQNVLIERHPLSHRHFIVKP